MAEKWFNTDFKLHCRESERSKPSSYSNFMTVICPQRSPLILHNRHIRMYSTKDCRICGAQRDQPTVSCCSYRAIDKWGRSSKRIDIDDIESLACILFS